MSLLRLDRIVKFCGLLLVSALVPGIAGARIVNTQDTLFSIHENGLYLNSDIGMDWLTGTAEVLQFTGELGSQWLREPHLLLLSGSGAFARKDDERFINKYFGHMRYRYRIWEWVMAEAFVQGEFNEFRRLLVRVPCGIGPRLEFVVGRDRRFQIAFGTSYMYEFIKFSEDEDDDGEIYSDSLTLEHNHRWNNYLAVKVNFSFLSLGATIYAQPRFDDFSDFMILLESNITFKVTDKLSVGFSYTLFRDSTPPEGIINQDTALKALLKMDFGPWFTKPATKPAPSESEPEPETEPETEPADPEAVQYCELSTGLRRCRIQPSG